MCITYWHLLVKMATELSSIDCCETPAQAAVQVNIVGRDGSMGPPLFISPQRIKSRVDLFDLLKRLPVVMCTVITFIIK